MPDPDNAVFWTLPEALARGQKRIRLTPSKIFSARCMSSAVPAACRPSDAAREMFLYQYPPLIGRNSTLTATAKSFAAEICFRGYCIGVALGPQFDSRKPIWSANGPKLEPPRSSSSKPISIGGIGSKRAASGAFGSGGARNGSTGSPRSSNKSDDGSRLSGLPTCAQEQRLRLASPKKMRRALWPIVGSSNRCREASSRKMAALGCYCSFPILTHQCPRIDLPPSTSGQWLKHMG